jgi:NDP-sugar pyrophosphorylase family protein
MPKMPKIAILAGGLATRMRPLTNDCPKALLPVAGEPFAFHQLRLLRTHGFDEALFLIGYLGEQIVEAVGDGSRFGMSVDYLSDGPELRGTGGAIARALPMLGDSFAVIYGDSWLEFDYGKAVAQFQASAKPALMTVISAQIGSEEPNVEYADGRVILYSKTSRTPNMGHIDYGFSLFDREVFADLPDDRPVELAAIQERLSRDGNLLGFETDFRYYEIGSMTGRQELEDHLKVRGRDVPQE